MTLVPGSSLGAYEITAPLGEGEDLADRLKRGPLPLDEALAVVRQIAQALEAAHEKGVVHRDLKPANVKLTPDGKLKVLDFGLAKAMDPPAGSATAAADLARSPTLMNSPTLTSAQGTQLRVILGTAGYMSPEQARGGTVDKRADIWAFGVVFSEMLTARRLFEGDTVSDTLAAVLRQEIDWRTLAAATPAPLRRLLRLCLERNPKYRLHDVADARLALDELLSGRPEESTVAAAALPERAPQGERIRALARRPFPRVLGGGRPLSGSARRDLLEMPKGVIDTFGFALYLAQTGEKHEQPIPLHGFGSAGVIEISDSHRGNAYRGVYTVRFAVADYVPHCFQKESTRGDPDPGTRYGAHSRAPRGCSPSLRKRAEMTRIEKRTTNVYADQGVPDAPRMLVTFTAQALEHPSWALSRSL